MSPSVDADRAAAVVAEAEELGVLVGGALSPVGRALLDPDPAALAGALAEAMPAARTRAYFLADLTATVTGAASAGLAALLDSAADRAAGSGATWRFSPSSVRRAFDHGATAAGLLAALADASEKPLPQALEYLVGDVGRRYGETCVVAVSCCVVAREPELLAEVLASRQLAALGLRRLAPTVAASAASPGETLDALRLAGYFPSASAGGHALVVGPDVPTPPAAPAPRPPAGAGAGAQDDLPCVARTAPSLPSPPSSAGMPEQVPPSRVHLPAPSLEEQAAALVGTSTEEPDRYSTRLHIVNRYYVQHLSMEEGYWLSAAVHSGTPVRLVVRDDPGHPRGHVVEGLTSTGEAFTGWCASHDVPFAVTAGDIMSVAARE